MTTIKIKKTPRNHPDHPAYQGVIVLADRGDILIEQTTGTWRASWQEALKDAKEHVKELWAA